MAIVAVGMDLVEVERVARLLGRWGAAFTERVFTAGERAGCGTALDAPRTALYFAGRFAAKEAVLKVLGTGWGAGIGWHDVGVERGAAGAPLARLTGAARRRMEDLAIARVHLSITHDAGVAAAVAVGERAG